MVTALFKVTSISAATSLTAFMTSESLPTPDGSMITRSGLYLVSTSARDFPKSPTREQQMQPLFISRISIPESFKNPPSMPISPNSFSIKTTCSPEMASSSSFLIKVVLPAPRKPDIISIFVISFKDLFSFQVFHSLQLPILSQTACKVKPETLHLRKTRNGSAFASYSLL